MDWSRFDDMLVEAGCLDPHTRGNIANLFYSQGVDEEYLRILLTTGGGVSELETHAARAHAYEHSPAASIAAAFEPKEG